MKEPTSAEKMRNDLAEKLLLRVYEDGDIFRFMTEASEEAEQRLTKLIADYCVFQADEFLAATQEKMEK